MLSLWSLFTSPIKQRCYALVDANGICQGFHQSRSAPQGPGWVEVSECRLSWLQHPLPASVRILQVVAHPVAAYPLPA